MEKITDIKKYRQTVFENMEFFKKYYYHSIIDLNLVKLDCILKNGILSKELIEEYKLPSIYTHRAGDVNSKNGDCYVSLSEFTDQTILNQVLDSFALHTLTSVSVLVNKKIKVYEEGERITFFSDEVFAFGEISNSKIEGIMYPEHLSKLPISDICCLPRDMSCYSKEYIHQWITYMETYFNKKMNREKIMECFKLLKTIIDQYSYVASGELVIYEQKKKYGTDLIDVLASELQKCWSKKLCISTPTFAEVIKRINDDRFPVYEIKEKALKKIN